MTSFAKRAAGESDPLPPDVTAVGASQGVKYQVGGSLVFNHVSKRNLPKPGRVVPTSSVKYEGTCEGYFTRACSNQRAHPFISYTNFNPVFMIKSPTLRLTFAAAVIAAVSGNTGMCFAQATSPPKSMALRAVMKSLGRHMQTTTDAISKEDWALVAETAQKIAHHAEPPLSERKLILDWLGSNSEPFEDLDEHTHEVARAMRKAAESGDGQEVIENFAKLQNSCLACHQRFRKAFVEHFYAQN